MSAWRLHHETLSDENPDFSLSSDVSHWELSAIRRVLRQWFLNFLIFLMTQEQCSRSSRRCRHVLPPLLIFIGLRVGWYASRTLTACLPYALSLHLHAPPAQAMPRSSSSANELPEAEREISTTCRACLEINGQSTSSSATWTHEGALFV